MDRGYPIPKVRGPLFLNAQSVETRLVFDVQALLRCMLLEREIADRGLASACQLLLCGLTAGELSIFR